MGPEGVSLIIQFLTFVATGILGWLGKNMYRKLDDITETMHTMDVLQSSKFAEHELRLKHIERQMEKLQEEVSEIYKEIRKK